MTTRAELLGRIKTIGTRGANLDTLIQQTGLEVLIHSAEFREVSLIIKLYDAMPKGSRRLALAHWLVKYGMVKVNPSKDKEQQKKFPFLFDGNAELDKAGAATNNWFDAKKEKTLRDEFDLDLALANFQKVLDRAIKGGKVEANDERIRDVIPSLSAASDRIKAEAEAAKKAA